MQVRVDAAGFLTRRLPRQSLEPPVPPASVARRNAERAARAASAASAMIGSALSEVSITHLSSKELSVVRADLLEGWVAATVRVETRGETVTRVHVDQKALPSWLRGLSSETLTGIMRKAGVVGGAVDVRYIISDVADSIDPLRTAAVESAGFLAGLKAGAEGAAAGTRACGHWICGIIGGIGGAYYGEDVTEDVVGYAWDQWTSDDGVKPIITGPIFLPIP